MEHPITPTPTINTSADCFTWIAPPLLFVSSLSVSPLRDRFQERKASRAHPTTQTGRCPGEASFLQRYPSQEASRIVTKTLTQNCLSSHQRFSKAVFCLARRADNAWYNEERHHHRKDE